MRAFAITVASTAALLFIGALTRAPYTPPGSDAALLRFSWRTSVSAKETCRKRTHEELEHLPVHMRTPEVCTRDVAHYLLITRIDEGVPDTLPLVRGGVKQDRPLFVLEERALPSGRHRVRVDLERVTAATRETLATLDRVLTLREGEVQLVTLDADADHLSVRSSSTAARESHRRDHDDHAEKRTESR
jgi:hypothetical protein